MALNDFQHILSNTGLHSLGIASPHVNVHWTSVPTTVPTEGAAGGMTLVSVDSWVAPMAGILTLENGQERITQPNGNPISDTAYVFTLFPEVYLRLQRMMAVVIEGKTDLTHRTDRPVPYYFVYTTTTDTKTGGPDGGKYRAGEDLGFSGTLTIHDKNGLPICPVAVANILDALVEEHPILEARPLTATPQTAQANRQIFNIGQLGANQVQIHITDPFGQPDNGTLLSNITAIGAGAGLFSINANGTAISATGTGVSDDYRLGLGFNGTIDTGITYPTPSVTLHRDFIRGLAVDLNPFLIGTVPAADPAEDYEERPEIRHDETVTFHLDGNAAMGGANQILDGDPEFSFAVAPAIENGFDVPDDATDDNAQWPNFPPTVGETTGAVNIGQRVLFNPTAHFLDGTDADVIVVFNGLLPGQAIRIYNRVFLPDAREGKGDGAGAIASAQSTGSEDSVRVAFTLKDPLGLVERGVTTVLPTTPTLHMDVVVVNTDNRARVFGNVTCEVGAKAVLSVDEQALIDTTLTNPFVAAEERSICSAGILGLTPPPLSGLVGTGADAADIALALSGEGNPRESPRLPTMSRRDTIIASGTGGTIGTWQAQLSAMHLVGAARTSNHRLGSPGSPGGPEWQVTAAQTGDGLLAYDLARAAYRRTEYIVTRLIELAEDEWNDPAAATGGTIAGATLQTISPACETPELSFFEGLLDDIPDTWNDLLDWLGTTVSLPSPLDTGLDDQLDDLRDNPNGERLYNELKREFVSSVHGRRDAFWALRNAITHAREFIYIEGPALLHTDDVANPDKDLLKLLKDRMTAVPGLRIIVALPKQLDYGPGYEMFAAREYKKRLDAIEEFEDVRSDFVPTGESNDRFIAFHPLGFPGRPIRLQSTVVIVDDQWCMLGSSAIRRRGMTFDGGQDLVLFDRQQVDGKGRAIADFRRRLMARILNVRPPDDGNLPSANWIRLNNGATTFEVFRELLDNEGAGVIEEIWDGRLPGTPVIDPASFPSDDIADPDGREFETLAAILLAALANYATPSAPP